MPAWAPDMPFLRVDKVPDAVVGGGLPLAAFGSWEWEGVGLLGHRGVSNGDLVKFAS